MSHGFSPLPHDATTRPLRLGIDFDNTIVCYDALFHRVALEDGVIPADLPANKSDVRNHLRSVGREDLWTEMQGRVYGARMREATPYPGVLDFFRRCRARGIPVFIVSHKTRRPFAGEPYDLHAAALDWLLAQGFFEPEGIGMPRDRVFFELTKPAKLERIAACGCSDFIDDLPELLAEPSFPSGVARWLFDPNDLYRDETRFARVSNWTAIHEALLSSSLPAPAPSAASVSLPAWPAELESLKPEVERLLEAGLGGRPQPTEIEPLPGGANNRVYRIRTVGRDAVLKRYFHSPNDPRDRFRAEHGLYQWAAQRGIRCLPTPLGWDPEHRLGLMEFVVGRKLEPGQLEASHVAQAVDFVEALNAEREQPFARALPIASEACFSDQEHLKRIDQRVSRLEALQPETAIDHEAAAFVQSRLAPAWRELRARIVQECPPNLATPLSPTHRCLSPSDFGFHNALLTDDGRLRFLDFEYAGWDDPTKLIGDFFSQPQVPIGIEHWSAVVDPLDHALGWNGSLGTRAALFLPAYRLKWCCIRLNEFLATDRARREFAAGGAEAFEERKARQLAAARAALSNLTPAGLKT